MHMRQEAPSLVGRDHLAYRSSYMPVRSVVDGDLCVMFGGLANDVQKSVSSELDRTAAEIAKKVEEVCDLISTVVRAP
jgi:splicing factor 3B subunit 3